MDKLEFPEVTDADIAFGNYPRDWFKKILGEKTENLQKMKKLFSDLFFTGGQIPVNKKLGKDYVENGIRIFKAIAGSYSPKHEDKEEVCAVILKAICE